MLQTRFLAECRAARRKAILDRVLHGVIHAALTLIFMIGFGVFFFTAVNIPAPIVEGLPSWMWTGGMVAALLQCAAGVIYCTFRTLDEISFNPGDRRRITGAR